MFEWIQEHTALIVEVAAVIYVVAKAITNLTPSEKDNALLASIVKYIDYFIDLIIPNLKKKGGVHTTNLFIKKK